MKNTLKWNCLLRGVHGFMWVEAGFLGASLAFASKAWWVHEQAQFQEVIFWLFLAAWGKALAIGVVGLFLVLMIVRGLWHCRKILGFHLMGGSRKNIGVTRSLTVGRAHVGGARHS